MAAFTWTPRKRAMAARHYARVAARKVARIFIELDVHECPDWRADRALIAAGTDAWLLTKDAEQIRRVLEDDLSC